MEISDIEVFIVQETKPPFRAGDKKELADTAARNGADASDYHNQQDLVGHG